MSQLWFIIIVPHIMMPIMSEKERISPKFWTDQYTVESELSEFLLR